MRRGKKTEKALQKEDKCIEEQKCKQVSDHDQYKGIKLPDQI